MLIAGFGRNLRRGIYGLLLLLALAAPHESAALTVTSQQDVGNITVMEVSGDFNMLTPQGTYNSLARADAAKKFFETHRDEYDFLIFFTNFDTNMPSNVGGFYLPVHRDIQGIGKPVENYSSLFGSNGRLMATIDMGDVHKKALDPADPEFETTLHVLTHEFMHHWGAYAKFRQADGTDSSALLGLDGGHWSYLLDSNSSTLYGNHWRDNGDGTFTSIPPETTLDNTGRGQLFSPLELYLMGIYDKSQVPPMLLIKNPFIDPKQLPQLDETVYGEASQVTIDDIIAAEGERVPSAANAQKSFRMGFVYLYNTTSPDFAQVAELELLRSEWIKRFSILTDGQGLMEVRTDLPKTDGLSTNPGVIDPTFTPNPTPTVNAGVDWLASRQLVSGAWQDQPATATRDTAAAVAALAQFPGATSNYQSGLAWLGTAAAGSTDYLARQIEGLEDKGAAVTALLALQNVDGGWGSAAGYVSNPTDTGLALQALASAGQSGSAVQGAVSYLLETQNADGGWGVSGTTSMVQSTAFALQALNDYRGSYTVATEVAQAAAWLGSKQNADGGFGNSPSTVYDTASAVVALRQAGATQSVVANGAAYLLTRQNADGSWNGSVFQTALATEALWVAQVQADLSIVAADISFNPTSAASVPAALTVTATVRNAGSADVGQIKVALYAGDPSVGTLLDEELVSVAGHGATPVVFNTVIGSQGQHPLTVVIDPDQQLAEGDEANNQATKTFLVEVPPPVITFALAAASVNEDAGSLNLQVVLDHPWSQSVTVNYAVAAGGTATAGSDYTLAGGVLTFAPEETSKSIILTVINDSTAENDETLSVDLSAPVGGTLGALTRQTVTILDNELPLVTITSPSTGTSGDNTPLLSFTVSRGTPVVKVDGVVVAKVSGNELDALTDGPHTVRVEAANAIGGVGFAEVSFAIDTTVPTVVITSPTSGYVLENNPLLTYTVDSAATVTVKVDGIIVNKVSGERLDVLADGSHTVLVEATNAFARTGTAQVAFTVDTKPPTVKIEYPTEGILEENAPKLLYATTGAGTVMVMVDGEATNKVSGEYLMPLLDGGHQLRVTITSPSGLSATQEIGFVVSSEPEPAYGQKWQEAKLPNEIWEIKQLAIDSFGNAFVAGDIVSSYRMALMRYDSRGVFAWSKSPWTTSTQGVRGVGVDSSNNIYVGFASVSALDGYDARGAQDGYLTKFDMNGDKVWTRQIASTMTDYVHSVYVDKNDFIYVAGITGGTIGYGGSGGWQVFVAKYNKNGDRLWASQMSLGTTASLVYEDCYVTADIQGNVYLAGTEPARLDLTETNLGGTDYFLIKYDSNGNEKWKLQGGTPQGEVVQGVGTDPFGDVYIAGGTGGALPGYTTADGSSFIVKLNTNKQIIWNHQWNGGVVKSLAIENDGNILAACPLGLYKFDRDKTLMWSNTPSELGIFVVGSMATDSNGNVYIGWEDNSSGYRRYSIKKFQDVRLPAVSLSLAGPSLTNNPAVKISGTMESGTDINVITNNQGVCSVSYQLPTTWNCDFNNLDDGLHYIKAVSTKSNGFKNFDSLKLVLDTIPPAVSIITPGDWQTYSDKPILNYTVSEGNVRGFLNGSLLEINQYPLEELLPGVNLLKIEATDNAGNFGSDQVEFYAEGAAVGEKSYSVMLQNQDGTTFSDTVDESTHDSAGNFFVVGTTYGNLDSKINHGLADAFLRKYDQSGNLILTLVIGTTDNEYGKGVAVDNNGNIYVLWEVEYNSVKGRSEDFTNVIVGKYDSTGMLIWTSQIGSKQKDYAVGLAYDNSTSILYVAGNTEGSIDRSYYGGGKDYFIAAINSSGSTTWLIQSGYYGDETVAAISVRDSYALYLAVNSQLDVNRSRVSLDSYDLNGNRRLTQYPYTMSSTYDVICTDILIDSFNNHYLVGRVNKFDGMGYDYFVAKHNDSKSTPLWLNDYGSVGIDEAISVDVNGLDELFITGTTDGSLQNGYPAGGKDFFVTKYSNSGIRKWIKQFGTTGDDISSDILVHPSGDLLISGETNGQLGSTPPIGSFDTFLMKMVPVP